MRDAMKIFGYISPFEHGFALPAYHADADTFNAWYMAVPRIAGDHCAPIDDFEILEGNIEPCEGSRALEEGDAWNDVFLWDGAAHVGTPKEIFEQIKRARKHMEKEAPFSLLDLALAAGAPGTDKIARQAFAYAKRRMGATQGAICFVEAAIRPGVLLEICRFAAENDHPVVRSNAVRRIALRDAKRLTADIDLDFELLQALKNEELLSGLESRIAAFGKRIGAELCIIPPPPPIKTYGDPSTSEILPDRNADVIRGSATAPDDIATTTEDIAIDLGTGTTRIYLRNHGIVAAEPSVVLQRKGGKRRETIAVGHEAVRRATAEPEYYYLNRPLRGGIIVDDVLTEGLIRGVFDVIGHKTRLFRKTKVVAAIPLGLTKLQRSSVVDALENAGISDVLLIDKSLAAAIGADMPVMEPVGSMVVDIGFERTEAAVISLAAVSASSSASVGCVQMDEAIINYLRRNHDVLISPMVASQIRLDIGRARYPDDGVGTTIRVKGRSFYNQQPREIATNQAQIFEALCEPLGYIVECVRLALESTPPELAADLVDQGIVLTGGGAWLPDIDQMLRDETGLPVTIAEDPETCTILGAGRALEEPAFQRMLYSL